ncbi:Acylpyruvase fahd1, mitochondrial [Allomyces javanicus]|nr:Acylpyruvase fahd1, mitochondrial [Allomyces javanicus]
MSSFRTVGRKIVAIGRNFADHAKELGNAVPSKPMLFLKPTSSYAANGKTIEIPSQCDVHHEVELGVVIGQTARRVSEADAMKHVAGYTLAIDMTARDLQNAAKKAGHPWSVAKGFDDFTPITDMVSAETIKDPHNVRLWLKVNGETKQDGTTQDFIFGIPRLISHVSQIMTLEEGDVILTGTPKGVGPVRPGDHLEAAIESEGEQVLHGEWNVAGRHVDAEL